MIAYTRGYVHKLTLIYNSVNRNWNLNILKIILINKKQLYLTILKQIK